VLIELFFEGEVVIGWKRSIEWWWLVVECYIVIVVVVIQNGDDTMCTTGVEDEW